ncbi:MULTISPECIES: cyclase family protein [Deinococcus]|uniref:Kynurenine formamidase n=1 Tax=Deinococcus geothermalis (strain DSM 11300 / CIP 105573 / AG-3a) TaxID=319795 RepID=KYNB_DEIGD|nr:MULTISPECIES: cyclase family protein [Deinococcus]Q1IY56.1 RecName: Full=Kynurenine formamidase; Short=KFA; Short=KFase; AltName: Full=Arylformamidase; AltName: Full=N-formylkynurenine formamidase; Short=FKF [Deinococcus geothermalis DSM 11300]ABF45828.1 Kynurenine formamidase [Deinococcus geothermalis DSM 11300]MBI0446084.1 kynurenine formamidase [Deinococcus sp. DB0503]
MIDISRQLTPSHPNWPGDAPFRVKPGARIAQGDSVNTGELCTSTHTGTHVDAPWHYSETGARLEEVELNRYVGRCRVVTVRAEGGLIPAAALAGLPKRLPPRLLLHTGQPAHWTEFPEDFAALDPALIREAARRGVRLIGTDSPSVDPLTSKTLDAHHACLETDTLILEGLNLAEVPDGEYDLVCLPLPLAEVDGAPARAILLPAGTLPEGEG